MDLTVIIGMLGALASISTGDLMEGGEILPTLFTLHR